MIGAHKCKKADIIRLQQLFAQGYNNSEIHRNFRTESGHQISREHVRKIRNGIRWNSLSRSYVMKDELGALKTLSTICDRGNVFYSEVGKVITKTGEKWVFFHFKDKTFIPHNTYLFDDETTAESMFYKAHQDFLNRYL